VSLTHCWVATSIACLVDAHLSRMGLDRVPPGRQVQLRQVEQFRRVAHPAQMRIDQARAAVADQECFEDAVASHRGEVVGKQQRCFGRVDLAVERHDHARVASHGSEA
jgi:hypothetical protein